MSYKALLSIDGYDLPQPSSYVGTTSTLVDSARNAQGYVIGSVLREDVAKVEATWNYLTATQWATVLKKFNSSYGGSFYNNVTFFNQVTNGWETRQMYVSDRTSGGAFMTDPSTGAITGYKSPKLSLVQT